MKILIMLPMGCNLDMFICQTSCSMMMKAGTGLDAGICWFVYLV